MPDATTATQEPKRRSGFLAPGKLGTWGIVALVFAAVTPLVGLTSNTSLAMSLGGGAGIVGLYLLVGLFVLCFQAGYSAMSTELTNAGAFYAYITRGIGRPAGLAAALLSVLTYNFAAVILSAYFGFYVNVTMQEQLHVNIPWQIWSGVVILAAFVLGRRNIDLSSKLLAIAVGLETVMALIFVVSVLARRGIGAFSLGVFDPSVMFAGQIAVAISFVVFSFGGIEANAIFGEEARNMKRSVRRAGYLGVGILTVLYVLGAWALVGTFGTDSIQAKATEMPGTLFFTANTEMVGQWSTNLIQWMLCFSLFAGVIGIHNFANRYFFALGRDGVFPRWLAQTHPKTRAPHHAGELQICILVAILGAFMLAGADPMLTVVTSLSGLVSLTSTLLWATVSAAALTYFWKRHDVNVVETKIAPIVAVLVMAGLFVTMIIWYKQITGTSGVTSQLPWFLLFTVVTGIVYALWLRRNRPAVYANLGQTSISEGLDAPAAGGDAEPRPQTVPQEAATSAGGVEPRE